MAPITGGLGVMTFVASAFRVVLLAVVVLALPSGAARGAVVDSTLEAASQEAASVPEPARMVLLGVALFGFAALTRRRRRQH